MSVILYARVSTGEQAERDLSIPAQFRALRALAVGHGWAVAAEFQDVGTGRRLKERPGIMAAVRMLPNPKDEAPPGQRRRPCDTIPKWILGSSTLNRSTAAFEVFSNKDKRRFSVRPTFLLSASIATRRQN
jgi:hypothetical protein